MNRNEVQLGLRICILFILFIEKYVRTLTYFILAYVERYVHCTLVTVAF